ncbi:MAG: hypothetical protein KBT04_08250 [Bacteroidales bacterium]|nr:hypothetical protein [Candidatus Colimorpha onthohippi]
MKSFLGHILTSCPLSAGCLLIAFFSLSIVACDTDDPMILSPIGPDADKVNGWILCQGSDGDNNSSLDWFDPNSGTIAQNMFVQTNRRFLGEGATDLLIYGSKMYISMRGSRTIEVVNASSGRSIRQINLDDRIPLKLASGNGMVYAACTHPNCIIRIDTTTNSIDTLSPDCMLDDFRPEGICALGGSLCVSNSWEYLNNYDTITDSTISIISTVTFSKLGKLIVGHGPTDIVQIKDSRLAIRCIGDSKHAPQITVIDITNSKRQTIPIEADFIAVYRNDIYTLCHSNGTQLFRINGTTLEISPIALPSSVTLQNPSQLYLSPISGDIYISDAAKRLSPGMLYCLTNHGSLRWKSFCNIGPVRCLVH